VFTSDVERFGQGFDSDLFPVGPDQAYFTGPDPLVDPGVSCRNRRITLSVGGLAPGTRKRRTEGAPFVIARLQALLSTRRTSFTVAGWEVANSSSTPIFPVSCRA